MHILVSTLLAVCPAFAPVSGGGYDHSWTEYAVNADGIAAIMALDTSRSFWLGYDAGGFAMPADATDALRLTLYTEDGRELWFDVLWSEATPDTYYALPFAVTEAYADANGEHYGTHPCAAFTLTRAQFARLLAALG